MSHPREALTCVALVFCLTLQVLIFRHTWVFCWSDDLMTRLIDSAACVCDTELWLLILKHDAPAGKPSNQAPETLSCLYV